MSPTGSYRSVAGDRVARISLLAVGFSLVDDLPVFVGRMLPRPGQHTTHKPDKVPYLVIASFKYLPLSTPIHRLDPRTKIVMLLCTAFTAATVRDLRALLALLIVSVLYYSLARLPWSETRAAWT